MTCALLLGLAGCMAETQSLGDGGELDLGGPRDAEPNDAGGGLADLGTLDGGEPVACTGQERVSVLLEGNWPESFEGRMTLQATALIRLADLSGERRIALGGRPFFPPDVTEMWARVDLYEPFWREYRVRLYALDEATGGPGPLLWVAWSGSQYASLDEGGWSYRYSGPACARANDGCGRQEGLQLEATVNGKSYSVGPRQLESNPALSILNGDSARFVDGPFCTDTPGQWYAGVIALTAAPRPSCRQLSRDACIAAAGCVLYGSEDRDPRYICLEASGPCESLPTREACQAGGLACGWDVGECYCPEGAVCACGGGPAPKCRSLCGTAAGLTCPDGRFCEEATLTPPMCLQPPDGGGRCDWAPTDCSGVSNVAVCACTTAGPRRFGNDCLRRQSRAGVANASACP